MAMMFVVLACLLQEPGDSAPAGVWNHVVTTRLTTIELPPRVLGRGWSASAGVRIDDLESADTLEEPLKEVARALKEQLTPLGVRSVGDYTLVKSGFPLNTVTVRVFVFKDAQRCRDWWRTTYQFPDWKAQYNPAPSDQFEAVDSRKSNKRIIAFGNVVMTAHQLGDGEEHLVALQHLVDAITARSR